MNDNIHQHEQLLDLTTAIVAAHVSRNSVAAGDIPDLIKGTFKALVDTRLTIAGEAKPTDDKPVRAHTGSVKSSIKRDGIVSMIDGKSYKMLRRHIGQHGYTPESYREAFGLPADYPMVAPDYAEKRRALALQSGLGTKRKAA